MTDKNFIITSEAKARLALWSLVLANEVIYSVWIATPLSRLAMTGLLKNIYNDKFNKIITVELCELYL